MRRIKLNIQQVNFDSLQEELVVLPGFIGLNGGPDGIFAVVTDAFENDAELEAIVLTHDPNVLTEQQRALLQTSSADQRMRGIPSWATWDEDQVIFYLENNVTDLASAKTVLIAMGRLLVALRDKTWPTLTA